VSLSAATLAAVPAGESPAGGDCPVTTVVIPGVGEGDRPDGSPGVKASVGRGIPGRIRQGRRATRHVVAMRTSEAVTRRTDAGGHLQAAPGLNHTGRWA